jgi:hypothetical protein
MRQGFFVVCARQSGQAQGRGGLVGGAEGGRYSTRFHERSTGSKPGGNLVQAS